MKDINIGDRIRELREQKGLTQKELGELINVSAQVISNWERGYTPTINYENIIQLARALDTTVAYLVGKNDEKEKSLSLNQLPPDIRKIARAGDKMTPEQRDQLLKIAYTLFPEAFNDKQTDS